MKRQVAKIVMIILQFIFYFVVNKLFDVPDRIMYNTFFIYLALNLSKNMYSFRTILIWEELKKLILVHLEYLVIMLINDFAFWGTRYIPVHLIIGLTFTFFNIFIIRFIRTVFRKNLEKTLLIIGIGNTAKQITKIIKDNNTFTMYKILGYISVNNLLGINQSQHIADNEIIGDYSSLNEILKLNKVNEVIIALPLANNEQMEEIINELDGKVDKVKFIPQLNNIYTLNSTVEDYDGMMVISTYNGLNKQRNKIIKRIFDIIIGFIGYCVFVFLYLIVAPKIKKDGGKTIFKQDRIGQNLKLFKMYKFRSMYVNAEEKLKELLNSDFKLREEYYKNFKLKNDPRITKIGKFLRRTSLDEFPQFINVLKGEMSFVGPRPVVQKEVDMYYGKENAKKIFLVKPGITGMWQANGRSDIEDYDSRIALDLYYIRNWSLWLDIIIMIKTIKNVISKKGAY